MNYSKEQQQEIYELIDNACNAMLRSIANIQIYSDTIQDSTIVSGLNATSLELAKSWNELFYITQAYRAVLYKECQV